MPITGQDDKFYLTDTGGKIAKSGLSTAKNKEYQDLLASMSTPQNMTPIPPAQAPMLETVPVSASPFESPAPGKITSLDQLNMAPPAPQASLGGAPMGMPQEPIMQAPVVSPLMGMREDIKNEFTQGIQTQQMGARKLQNALAKGQLELDKEAQALAEEKAKIDADIMRANEERDLRVKEAAANLETLKSNYAKAKIDPDRYFAGSTGKRIMAGIAIAFGEIGRALSGGNQNAALNIIQKAIDDDIASQKEDVTNKQNQVLLARQGLADVKDLYKDKTEALMARRIMAVDMAKDKIKSIADRIGTQEAMAKADIMIGQLDVQRADALGKMFDYAAKKQQAAPLTDQQMKAVSELSSAYEGNEGIKSFGKIDLAYKKMENLVKLAQTNPNAAQAIITTFNRVLDENSVVREAEVNLTMAAGSAVDRFKQNAEKVLSGTMTPQQAQNLLQAAKELRNAALTGKQKLDQRFVERANAFGVPSQLVISPSAATDKDLSSLTSLTPRGGEQAPKTQTANRVMPGR